MKVSRYAYASSRKDDWKIIIFALSMLGIGAIIGGFVSILLFIRLTGGNASPSEAISAPTLSLETLNQATESTETQNGVLPPTTLPLDNQSTAILVTPHVTEQAPVQTSTVLPPQLFRIVSEESQARFFVFETFPRGTAVGRTNQIAGDIIVDFTNPSNSQLGTIRINLRTLTTDDSDRDSSIRCCVLLTSQPQFEFTDFVPTTISGLPEQVEIGQTIPFRVTGNLTLRGITSSVIFDVSLTLVSTSEIQGTANTRVNRTDFGILNDAENMFEYHGVAEEITLEFDFVARVASP